MHIRQHGLHVLNERRVWFVSKLRQDVVVPRTELLAYVLDSIAAYGIWGRAADWIEHGLIRSLVHVLYRAAPRRLNGVAQHRIALQLLFDGVCEATDCLTGGGRHAAIHQRTRILAQIGPGND